MLPAYAAADAARGAEADGARAKIWRYYAADALMMMPPISRR